jgi:hypothetical protein
MSNLFPATPPPQTPPRTPPQTPTGIPPNYDDYQYSSSNNNSQYSSDYNDEWDNYMNNPNVTRRRTRANSIPNDDNDDDFIQGRELLMSDLNDDISQGEEEEQEEQEEFDNYGQKLKPWAIGEMPPIPNYPKQIIDVNAEGFDPILMDNQKVEEYLKEDKEENVVILCNGKYYLTTRNTIEQQVEDGLVYECTKADKKRENVVGNLPLFNIKKIGIDLSSDNAAGIEPEYIYMDGIDDLLESDNSWQYYSIIPLPEKMLVSVISKTEALKIGKDFTGVSALHCQAGQGGMSGIIVKAFPSNSTETSGGKKKRKTMKKRKSMKKRKTVKKRKLKTIKKSNKKRKSGTKKRN